MKLIIFDLDQTLVDLIPVHDEVTRRLFRQFFGVEARLTEIDFAGKSLNDIILELARLKNVPEDDFQKNRRKLLESYGDTFAEMLPPDGKKYVLAGARELLHEVSRKDDIIALYTGSSRRIVDAVFEATGLGGYFRFCLYGTETESRIEMVRQAIQKARELTGRQFVGRKIVIVGDSVRDVACGKPFDALTIAVATGGHSPEKLKLAGADYVFADLKNYQAVLSAIEQHETWGCLR